MDDVAAFLTSEEASSEQIAEDNGLIDRARTQAENLLTAHVATARGARGDGTWRTWRRWCRTRSMRTTRWTSTGMTDRDAQRRA